MDTRERTHSFKEFWKLKTFYVFLGLPHLGFPADTVVCGTQACLGFE
jgi:hypothetical protein